MQIARPTIIALLAWAVGALAVAMNALAQPGDPAAVATAVGSDEVKIQVDQFGVARFARPGEWIGVQITVADAAAQPREIALRLSIPDPDGDIAQYQRVIASTPGVRQSVWLYARLPFNAEAFSRLTITAHEAEPGTGAVGGAGESRPASGLGRLLGSTNYGVQQWFPVQDGAMLVVGRSPTGLEMYGQPTGNGGRFLAKGHELTPVLSGVAPSALPDRWYGLSGLEALVWTASGQDGEPAQLREPQAEALREWVMRGGHLIVVVPSVGQQWLSPANPLLDIMPRVRIERREGVDYSAYRKILRRDPTGNDPPAVFPRQAIVHTVEPEQGAAQGEADRILVGPDGFSVVTRRLVGTGAVTLIGLDLMNQALGIAGLEADVFWHRVLGRRGDLLSPPRLAALAGGTTGSRQYFDSRDESVLDRGIEQLINKEGAAAAGLLLAFVVFLAYWAVAGPLSFAYLKVRKRTAWAWVMFVGACALFTGLAWGGANLIKPRAVEAKHLTLLDHVYGQNVQRARSWMSVLLPTYGAMTVSVGEPGEAVRGVTMHNALAAWAANSTGIGGGQQTFNDARTYVVNARDARVIEFPSRSTVKTVQADWAGGPRWAMPMPAGAGQEPRLVERTGSGRNWDLTGVLTHDLPGPMTDVTIIVVRSQLPHTRPIEGQLLVNANAWSVAGAWNPGQALDLSVVTAVKAGETETSTSLTQYIENRLKFGGDRAGGGTLTSGDLVYRMEALALFDVLQPPKDFSNPGSLNVLYQREATHTWDVSRWMTQPCVIILGHVQDQPLPFPMRVDGDDLPSTGRTVVRWVYPLGERPPAYPVDAPEGGG